MSKIRIVLIDDHPIVRAGVGMVLDNDDGLELVGEAGDLDSALSVLKDKQPDLVLLDIDLDGRSALDRVKEITAVCPNARILVLTGISDPKLPRQAALLGVQGYVHKNGAASLLATAIKRVHAGEAWFDRGITSKIVGDAHQRFQARTEVEQKLETLTPRERQIASLIAAGLVNKEIAARLRVKEKTIRNSLTLIYSKLGLSNRLELAIFAANHGLHRSAN